MSRTSLLFLAFSYFTLMVFVHVQYISPLFGYNGFEADFDWNKTFTAAVLIAVFCFLSKRSGVLGFYHQILLAVTLIPSFALFSAGKVNDEFILVTAVACLIVFTTSWLVQVKSLKTLQLKETYILWLCFSLSLFMIILIIGFLGVGKFNLNIMKVYEFRQDSSDNMPAIFGYIFPAIGKILLPMMIVIAAIKKRYFFLLSGFVFSVLIFGFTAHKSPLFYPFVILGVYYISGRKWQALLYLALIGIILLSLVDFYLQESHGVPFGIFGSLFTRRAIYVPVLLNNYYIDFFSQNPMLMWSESKFTFGLNESPYTVRAVNMIGAQYFGKPDMAANTGFIGSGYANAGWTGVILYSFILGLLISYFAQLGKFIGERFIMSATFVIMFVLITSSDFTTAILTHGLFALLLTLLVLPRQQWT